MATECSCLLSPISCYLPPEIIFEILSHLPPKTLIRFTVVCKAWNSTIHSEEFIKAHHDRSMKTNSRTIVLVQCDSSYDNDPCRYFSLAVDLDRDEFSNAVRIKQPFEQPVKFDMIYMLGYCNGLVCVRKSNLELKTEKIAVWNPLIQRLKIIPFTVIDELPADCKKSRPSYGFGYDSTNDDYKLVRVVVFTSKDGEDEVDSEVKIYSLKSNSWKKIQSLPCIKDFPIRSSHVSFLNGALRWLMCHKSDDKMKRVVSLDLTTEKYDEFPIPPVDFKNPTIVLKELLEGNVSASADKLNSRNLRDEFWIMMEYGVAAVWTWLPTIDIDPFIWKFRRYCTPLLFSDTREMVLLETIDSTLFWYDFEKKKIENVVIPDTPYMFWTAICVGNLHLLDGDPVTVLAH